jgi:hypothetical protein
MSHVTGSDVITGSDVTSGHVTNVTSDDTSLQVAHLSQIMMAYRSSKQLSTDQTPNIPPPPPPSPQCSQSNDEEPYYILKTDNSFLFLEPLYCGLEKYDKMKCLMTSCTRKTSNVASYIRFTEF